MTNGIPSWIKFIAQVGFPIVIALILLAALTGDFSRVKATVEENNRIVKQLEDAHHDQTRLLYQICRNTATTELQLARCEL